MATRTKPIAQSYHPSSNTDRVDRVGRAGGGAEPGPGMSFLSGFLGKSYNGDKNQTFMQMINALAQEEEEDERKREQGLTDDEDDHRHREEDLDDGTSTAESSSDSDDDVPRSQSLPLPRPKNKPPGVNSFTQSSTPGTASPLSESDDDGEPPSFLSPLPQAPAVPAPPEPIPTEDGAGAQPVEIGSSLYAIHRPVAARRRTETGEEGEFVKDGEYVERVNEPENSLTEEPGVIEAKKEHARELKENQFNPSSPANRSRSSTLQSKKNDRRKEKLAEKLEDIFHLGVKEDVVGEFTCWLFRSILLQGRLFLTEGHICFYAYLAKKEGATLRSGSLSVRGSKTRRYYKHWMVLKDGALAWYPSSTDPYFPDGKIDLHYCTSVEPSKYNKTHFKVSTPDKKWHFKCDAEASRDEWVKTVKKAVFQCQNEGESVKIAIPLETVIDIERSSSLEFTETIRIRVYDAEENFSIDEYWLSYFSDMDKALHQMTQLLEDYHKRNPDQALVAAGLIDTTAKAAEHLEEGDKVAPSAAVGELLSSAPINETDSHDSWRAPDSRLRLFPSKVDRMSGSVATVTDNKTGNLTPVPSNEHTYPPEPSPSSLAHDTASTKSSRSSHWSLPSIPNAVKAPGRKIVEVITGSSGSSAQGDGKGVGPHRVLSKNYQDSEPESEDESDKLSHKFQKAFGMSNKEQVIKTYPGYLYRGLPINGRLYISTSFLCFKSSGLNLGPTKMILPLNDVIGISKHRSYRIGYSGLVVVIKGHEEVFIELSSAERRDECLHALQEEVERVQEQMKKGESPGDSKAHQEHLALLDLAASKVSESSDAPRPPNEIEKNAPPVMFSSTSSDFVTFRPEKPLRFTCLTIGSRGDVQPYIALCKGLMAEGHSCKIASHGEYKDWVEGHGIGFEPIGGDPAELMQLMIAHDFFTMSFMKEALGRFRGWLDDLLESTWKACQNTDVLVESPSAIAGLHIAEALRIPYYRAFTMPWSRTRAYPHAFAVPDHKMGGGYNYMTYTMFDQIFWRATSGQVNKWRRNRLKIGPTTLEGMNQQAIPFLYNFSPVVVPPPLDWRENIHVTGYWWLDNPDDSKTGKWEPPEDLVRWMKEAEDRQKKIIFVGFGSIIIPDPEEMTRIVTQAVEEAGVYAIIAKGWSDRAADKNDSDEQKEHAKETEEKQEDMLDKDFIYNIKSIPHDWLFPRIAAAVHHGGAGTTGASLRAGLPTIIKPFFGDQHFYADRVQTLGIGSAVRNLTVDHLREAIITAVTDEKQISRANLAGEAIRREDGVGNAIECIYRDLEYAKTLIPKKEDSRSDPNSAEVEDEQDPKASPPERSATKKLGAPLQSLLSKTKTVVTPNHNSTDRSEPTSPPNGSSDEWDVLSNGTTSPKTSAARSPSRSRSATGSSRPRSVVTQHSDQEGHADGGITCGLDDQPDGRVAPETKAVNEEINEQEKEGKAPGFAAKLAKAIPSVLTGIPGKRPPPSE